MVVVPAVVRQGQRPAAATGAARRIRVRVRSLDFEFECRGVSDTRKINDVKVKKIYIGMTPRVGPEANTG